MKTFTLYFVLTIFGPGVDHTEWYDLDGGLTQAECLAYAQSYKGSHQAFPTGMAVTQTVTCEEDA